MKRFILIFGILASIGCQKKPDPPAPAASTSTSTPNTPNTPSTPPPPPPVTICQGATIPVSVLGQMPSNPVPNTKDFVITHFEVSCGDTLNVYIRTQGVGPGVPWTEIHDVPNGATYFTLTNQTVTVHNSTGNDIDVDIEAILK